MKEVIVVATYQDKKIPIPAGWDKITNKIVDSKTIELIITIWCPICEKYFPVVWQGKANPINKIVHFPLIHECPLCQREYGEYYLYIPPRTVLYWWGLAKKLSYQDAVKMLKEDEKKGIKRSDHKPRMRKKPKKMPMEVRFET